VTERAELPKAVVISRISQSGERPRRDDDFTDGERLAIPSHARWYALYTLSNREKRVSEQLANHGVEHFLPLYERRSKWKDRIVRLRLPLFPGYVFVRLALNDRLEVLRIRGVSRLVGFDGTPTPLAEDEISKIREILNGEYSAKPHRYLTSGCRIRVLSGPLEGMEGFIVRRKNGDRFVISLDQIQRSIAVEVSALNLQATQCGFVQTGSPLVRGREPRTSSAKDLVPGYPMSRAVEAD
jgi:transcription antitermination factor NusG